MFYKGGAFIIAFTSAQILSIESQDQYQPIHVYGSCEWFKHNCDQVL